MASPRASRAAIYVRVSTEDQDAEAQLAQLEALCKARGWAVGRVYRDVESGADPNRVALNELMHDTRVGRFGIVVFWAWDRVTRSGIEAAMSIMRSWQAWGVAWESLREPFLSSAADPSTAKLLLAIMAWVAEQERLRISDRTKAGLARRRALGIHVGRRKGSKDKKPRTRRWKRKPLAERY